MLYKITIYLLEVPLHSGDIMDSGLPYKELNILENL